MLIKLLSSQMLSLSTTFLSFPPPRYHFQTAHHLNNSSKTFLPCYNSVTLIRSCRNRPCSSLSAVSPNSDDNSSSRISRILLPHLAASVFFFVSFGVGTVSARVPVLPPATSASVEEDRTIRDEDVAEVVVAKPSEDEVSKAEFDNWKSKTFPLTAPLRIVALRGSIPPSWIKEFIQSQGKRFKLQPEFRGNIEDVFSELSVSCREGIVKRKSAVAADIVTMGDSWLSLAIQKSIIEPIEEHQDWFHQLSDKWKSQMFLRRNSDGKLDSGGKVWAAPYRWGGMVIAYKKSKFQKHNLAPIEDWVDLFQPDLTGRISMVDCPREIIGAVLKYMGSSYNTADIESEVPGGRSAVLKNLGFLGKQVLLFDSANYLKAFAVGDVWVAVGWSSDVLPAAKRMSNVTVVVPKSGSSLWADLWAVPALPQVATEGLGGRVRGPSPLIHQWIEFCLQNARALPFKQEVIPGAFPSALESPLSVLPSDLTKGNPKLETNLIAGVPPPEIIVKCEFIEPLSDAALEDYKWLLSNLQKPGRLNNFFNRAS